MQLERENSEAVIVSTTAKRSVDKRARELWDIVNGADDVLYAGNFDQ